ncbi:MAG: TonB-dependent receptor plug domain-containing protein [Lentisphaeraceae bacterium]|nr:TonB-dependent receptor plug domain-containing protein [Lentisphaeraceae bacterium]
MQVKVTSFDGSPKALKKTPAAVYVISSEDIKKSSARSVPELLRGAPGIQVSQIDSNTWAISSRGFTRRYSNKLQVLVDGRSIYTPLFSGVHWELNDVPLSEIERIEIIRGPGGSLWGANAVNGVINIITKAAYQTTGNLLELGVGDFQKSSLSYRFGEFLEEQDLAYRLTISGNQTGNFKTQDGGNKKDDWQQLRFSGRVDWQPDEENNFVTSFGSYFGETEKEINGIFPGNTVGTLYDDSLESYGFHWLGSWERQINLKNKFFAQVYYDHYKKEDIEREEENKSYSLDLRHVFQPDDFHKFTFGAGYRLYRNNYKNTDFLGFVPDNRQTDVFSMYIQDEMSLVPDELSLILGTKYEYNDHTGSELQPSAKLIWTGLESHTFWLSVARAVRTPNRVDEDIENRVYFAGPTEVNLEGSRDVKSEELIAYEAGYRYTPVDQDWNLDLSIFYHDYDRLNDFDNTGTALVVNNSASGYSYGAEVFLECKLTDTWNVKGTYSLLEDRLEGGNTFSGGNVTNMASLQSELNLTPKLNFYQNLYYTDHYSSARFSYNDTYRLDVGIRWLVNDNLTLSIWGVNLLDPQTLEYADDETGPAELPRSVSLQLEWLF